VKLEDPLLIAILFATLDYCDQKNVRAYPVMSRNLPGVIIVRSMNIAAGSLTGQMQVETVLKQLFYIPITSKCEGK
jgi:hypothetical protein